MRTELPVDRLQRRLGAESESNADGDGEPDTSLSRWLPDTTKSEGTAGWVAARLVPAALTSWAVTASGVLWPHASRCPRIKRPCCLRSRVDGGGAVGRP